MQIVNTLINASWIIPVDSDTTVDATVLADHSLAISDGKIVAILPTDQASTVYQAEETIDLSGHALIPGLINAHTHISMALLRGIADDMPLMKWLTEHIWPAEQKWISDRFCAEGAQLGMAEMIRSGTTCFNDMYFYPEAIAQEVQSAGMRAVMGLIVVDFPTAWAESEDEYFKKGLALHDETRSSRLLHTAFAPHAPYSVSDAPLQRLNTYAAELDIPIHMHIHEAAGEIHQAVEETGMRPLQRLDELGLLSPSLVGVHMTQLLDEEIDRYAETGGHVVHCPQSNMKLASGLCPVQKLIDAGINVALGTDGAASNNSLDMFHEMRAAALLGKLGARSASALPASQILKMATLNGAKALGIDGITGSLEPGKAADITAVDLGGVESQPVYDPLSQLIYSAGRDQVTQVWVEGRRLLKDGELTTLNQNEILQRTQDWRERIHASDSATD